MAGSMWTPAEDADVLELYPTTANRELAAILNERHGNGRSERSVGLRARKLGVRKADGYKHPMPARFWTPERRDWFVAFVPGHTEGEISAEHERLFGTPLTESQIGYGKTRFGVKSGTHGGRFVKGQQSWNKGKTWDEIMPPESQERSRAACFKKGEVHDRPDGWIKPIGYERVSKDGYVEVKVRDSATDGVQPREPGRFNCNYRMKHHVEWERANGRPVPPGTQIVFANHDRRDFGPENLVAVPRALWAVICRRGIEYRDRASLEAAMKVAELDRAISAARRRPRACRSCGRDFEPRYPNQKTCDSCLGRGDGARSRKRKEVIA